MGIGRHSRSFVDYGGVLLMCYAGSLLPQVGVHPEVAGWHGQCCHFSLAGQIEVTPAGSRVYVHSGFPGGKVIFTWSSNHGSVRRSAQSSSVSPVAPLGGPEWSSTWGLRRGSVDLRVVWALML